MRCSKIHLKLEMEMEDPTRLPSLPAIWPEHRLRSARNHDRRIRRDHVRTWKVTPEAPKRDPVPIGI